MAFTRRTEVRHISSAELSKIAQLLNQTFAWKKLMQSVPYELIDRENLTEGKCKYNLNDIRLIENATYKNKPPAEIFLEEWATSGKIRPTLSHLLQLLIRLELFRAADYVAVSLLNENPPVRPNKDSATKVDISLDDDNATKEILSVRPPELMNLNMGTTSGKFICDMRLVDSQHSAIQSSNLKISLLNVTSSCHSANYSLMDEDNNLTMDISHFSGFNFTNRYNLKGQKSS